MGKPDKNNGVGKFLWNNETKELLGRDGASWAKITFFYAVFYACLGSFFVGMLAVFFQIMPKDVPSYYGEASTMNARKINPGLGFRPQIDVEDLVIKFNPTVFEDSGDDKYGYNRYVTSLQNFLNAKYSEQSEEKDAQLIDCEDGQDYQEQLKSGKACRFDYKKVFAGTDCTEENSYGYKTKKACILIKLNKIVSWLPKFNETSVNESHIKVKCTGEGSASKDNIKSITYHSENHLNNPTEGRVSSKYFPYFSQKGYRSPFIFIQLEVTDNVMINVACKAYAENIDNDDRMNKRGQTHFIYFVRSNDN